MEEGWLVSGEYRHDDRRSRQFHHSDENGRAWLRSNHQRQDREIDDKIRYRDRVRLVQRKQLEDRGNASAAGERSRKQTLRNSENIRIQFIRFYLRDPRAQLAGRNFDFVVRWKRLCPERFFGVLEKVQLRSYHWRESDSGGDDEISVVDAVWDKSRKGQKGLLAPL